MTTSTWTNEGEGESDETKMVKSKTLEWVVLPPADRSASARARSTLKWPNAIIEARSTL